MAEASDRRERISRWVQGFETYEEPQERRLTDRAFRQFVVERIERAGRALSLAARDKILFPPQREALRAAMEILGERMADLADSVRSVPYEYGEFIAAWRLGPEEAEAFYERDEQVLRCLSAVQASLDPTLSPETPMPDLVGELSLRLGELSAAIRERQSAISGFTPARGREV